MRYTHRVLQTLIDTFRNNESRISEWFAKKELEIGPQPPYASIDVRNSGFKIAPVDTNIFPGGFNNLCPSYRQQASKLFKEYFATFYPQVRTIGIYPEAHTRNVFYQENIETLKTILIEAGFDVSVIPTPHLQVREKESTQEQETRLLRFTRNDTLILSNNDFSNGIPELIKKIVHKVIPTPLIGWHVREKSDHFLHYNKLVREFCSMLELDPWLLSPYSSATTPLSASDPESLKETAKVVDEMLEKTQKKYNEYGIKEKPYAIVKHNAGTYGMAVLSLSSGQELITLNKKQRAKIKMGKGKRIVGEVLVQEGIHTADRVQGAVAEPVIYIVGHRICGGFFRIHEKAGDTENLNQPGMKFTKLCFHEHLGYRNAVHPECDPECLKMVYTTIAKLASLAAGIEIKNAVNETEKTSFHH